MSPSSGAGWGGSSTKPWNACCDSGLGPQRVQAPQPAKPTRTIRAATSPSRRVVFRVTKVSPRLPQYGSLRNTGQRNKIGMSYRRGTFVSLPPRTHVRARSEEHTSELQSRENLVCRLLREKKKTVHALSTC